MNEATRARIAAFKRKHFGGASATQPSSSNLPSQPKAAKRPKPADQPLDMFADSSSEESEDGADAAKSGQLEVMQEDVGKEKLVNMQPAEAHNQHDWDDADGYYLVRVGEVLNGQYRVRGNVGRGVFSNVVICEVQPSETSARSTPTLPSQQKHNVNGSGSAAPKSNPNQVKHPSSVDSNPSLGFEEKQSAKAGETVAIKLIRNNPTMRRAAEKEIKLLKRIAKVPYVVELLSSFEHRKHLCLVFQPMKMNLRQVLYQYGKNIGINMMGVQTYGRQLFTALHYLKLKGIVHADLKLDNILVSEKLGSVKLCDFGSAFHVSDPDNDPTPYLVSRYYRAPEIILGLRYDTAVDTWALATCLFELYTGNVMFPGKNNNDMLRLTMMCKGRLPNRLLKKHITSYQIMRQQPHFDPATLKFRQFQEDVVTKEVVMKLVTITDESTKKSSVISMLMSKSFSDKDAETVKQLADLLETALKPDPAKRLEPKDALSHAFFRDKHT